MFIIQVQHKHQTKANDCWYACTQMLLTWKNDGTKTKPSGQHTMKLHSGLFGHTLHADYLNSKHLKGVLHENGLKLISRDEIDFGDTQSVNRALNKYGPMIVGGRYGEILKHLIKGLGHYVVLSGVDPDGDRYWVHDPWHTRGLWMDRQHFADLAWDENEGDIPFVCD